MLDCLINYIGVLGCDIPAPESSLYVNSLPGITLKQFESLTTEEKTTFASLWVDIQLRARARLVLDSRQIFNEAYKISSTKSGSYFGRKLTDKTTPIGFSPANTKRGFSLEFDWFENPEYKNSSLLQHYIQTISIYSSIVNTSTIEIRDIDLNEVLDTFPKQIEVGWNTIAVYKSYENRNIYIGIDSEISETYELLLPSSASLFDECRPRIRGVEYTTDLQTVTYGQNVYGLGAVTGSRCSWESFICQNKDLFTLSYWYYLGSELMNERLHSSRFNTFTTVDVKKAQDLKAQFDVYILGGEYAGVDYEGSLKQTIKGINISEFDCCLECNATIRIEETKSFW